MQKVRAQRDGAAVVMRDHVRSARMPVLEQVVQQFPLNIKGDRMSGVLRGLPIAGHIPYIGREL